MTRGRPARKLDIIESERARLAALARSQSAPHRLVVRAKAMEMVLCGMGNKKIGANLGISERTVCKWRKRFAISPRLESLQDAERSGRPVQIKLETRLELVKLACERPDKKKVAFRDIWTQQSLADALYEQAGVRISRSEVSKILNTNGLRPHRVRQWLQSQDPEFKQKVARICELYVSPPQDAVLLCIDEKPMQVLKRKYPTKIGPRGIVRYEYEYKRFGTRVLLGAFNVVTGKMFGQVLPSRKSEDIVGFMDDVARQYPNQEIYVVWDNLNIHHDGPGKRWRNFNSSHGNRFHFVYTPIHASWVNQVEVWFSILERRVLRHGSFSSAEMLEDTVHGFIDHWNRFESHPFNWKFRGSFERPRLDEAI